MRLSNVQEIGTNQHVLQLLQNTGQPYLDNYANTTCGHINSFIADNFIYLRPFNYFISGNSD